MRVLPRFWIYFSYIVCFDYFLRHFTLFIMLPLKRQYYGAATEGNNVAIPTEGQCEVGDHYERKVKYVVNSEKEKQQAKKKE
jgi:hypothetical protein